MHHFKARNIVYKFYYCLLAQKHNAKKLYANLLWNILWNSKFFLFVNKLQNMHCFYRNIEEELFLQQLIRN